MFRLLSVLTIVLQPISPEVMGVDAIREAVALVVIDSQLQALVKEDLEAYVRPAEARRGFPIGIVSIDGIDDWKPPQVRAAILDWLKKYTKLEGVMMVENIKLLSFFMPRADLPETRLWPRLY